MGKKRIKSRAVATKIQRRELVDWGLLARERISGGLTCETLRSSALLVLQLRLAGEVERDLDVLCIVNSEYVETLTPGTIGNSESAKCESDTSTALFNTILSASDIENCKDGRKVQEQLYLKDKIKVTKFKLFKNSCRRFENFKTVVKMKGEQVYLHESEDQGRSCCCLRPVL